MLELGKTLTARVGGAAHQVYSPSSPEEFVSLVSRLNDHCESFRLLGGGSNVIAADGELSTAVISTLKMSAVERKGPTRFSVQAGASLTSLGTRTARKGLGGLECCCGIPGTVGAAVRINAGGRFGEVADVLREVTYLTREGRLVRREVEEGDLGYRTSRFRDSYVLACEMEFTPDDADACKKRVKEVLQHKRETQPLRVPSAGCIFRNPAAEDDQGRPMSAGRLIDEAGLKGLRIGGAMVSPVHANYIVNADHATGCDFLALIEVVRRMVEGHSGIRLENEVEIWS